MVAIKEAGLDTIKLLIENNADINCKSDNGKTPITLSIKENNIDLVKLLIDKSVRINDFNSSVLQLAYDTQNNQILELLLSNGATGIICKIMKIELGKYFYMENLILKEKALLHKKMK